jgi:hypothetical protein
VFGGRIVSSFTEAAPTMFRRHLLLEERITCRTALVILLRQREEKQTQEQEEMISDYM